MQYTANHGDVELNALSGPVLTHINNKGSSFNARSITGSVTIEAIVDDRLPGLVLVAPDGKRHAVFDGMTLGRSSDNDATFSDGRMSRRHARIVAGGNAFAIEDAGSSNGTFVDGRAVAREVLVPGAVVTLGDTSLRVAADG